MPGIHEAARGFILDCAPNGDFHFCHLPPLRVRTSDQKSTINCSTPLNALGHLKTHEMAVVSLPALVVVANQADTWTAIEQRILEAVARRSNRSGIRQITISTIAPSS